MRTEKKIIASLYIPAHIETTNYYEFDELSKEIQERLITEKQDEIANDETFWDDWCYEAREQFNDHITEKFKGIENTDVAFSLSCCQGDGVSFTGIFDNSEAITALISMVYSQKIPRHIKRIIPYIDYIEFTRHKSIRYCHEYSVYTEIELNSRRWNYAHINKTLDELEKTINEYRAVFCRELAREGYASQDYYTSRDYAILELSENEYKENGEVA